MQAEVKRKNLAREILRGRSPKGVPLALPTASAAPSGVASAWIALLSRQ